MEAETTTTSGVLAFGVHRRSAQLGEDHGRPFSPYIPMVAVTAAVVGLVTALVLFRGKRTERVTAVGGAVYG